MKLIYYCILCIIVSLFISCKKHNRESQPNVLLIIIDDLGYHDLSNQGSKYYETPNIDKLSKNCFVFLNGYSTSPVCSPSRASILSGKYPINHGITNWIGAQNYNTKSNKLITPNFKTHISSKFQLLPELLKSYNYKTFFAGKWHLGGTNNYPENNGFNFNVGGYEKGSPSKGRYFSPFGNPKIKDNLKEKGIDLSFKLAKETNNFISENTTNPFFVLLSFYAVHGPIQTTQNKWAKYRKKAEIIGISNDGFKIVDESPVRLNQDNPLYAGLIEQVDNAIGVVLEKLEQLDLTKNTIIILTSDNGGAISGKTYATSNKPLRGGKGLHWEGGIKVPFMIFVPWLQGDGIKIKYPVIGTDIYPTIMSLLNISADENLRLDGINLVPLLKGNKLEKRALIWHYPHYNNQGGKPFSIIRQGRWKLIRYFEDNQYELYDLATDIGENHELSDQFPDTLSLLKEKLNSFLLNNAAEFPIENSKQYNDGIIQSDTSDLIFFLEKNRKNIYEETWQPNENWWGSQNNY